LCAWRGTERHQHGEANELVRHLVLDCEGIVRVSAAFVGRVQRLAALEIPAEEGRLYGEVMVLYWWFVEGEVAMRDK
jgi:hypothetical protein